MCDYVNMCGMLDKFNVGTLQLCQRLFTELKSTAASFITTSTTTTTSTTITTIVTTTTTTTNNNNVVPQIIAVIKSKFSAINYFFPFI
jgi:hypothetical protein